jgi:ABC-type multidrug transport system fused ATPase/permease subunit
MRRLIMLDRLNRRLFADRLFADRLFADPRSTPALLRRLLTEQARTHWRRYGLVVVLMAAGAVCTALPPWLLGRGIDFSYVYRSFDSVAFVAIAMMVIFALKWVTSYAQSVSMARIANRIVAEYQKRMCDKLLAQDVAFYADRHSSEFAAQITFGAGSAARVLDLLSNTLGRNLFALIGLAAVMVYQAPLLSLAGIAVMPPAVLGVRKLITQVRSIVLTQFGGGVEILEAMRETVQGFRFVKAFNLEAAMRARVRASVESVEAAANRLATVSNRSAMETLGGIAIAVMLLCAGFNVLVLGTAPGAFFSFVTAFLLAYEPAKRIARLNIDLHNSLPGVQILFDTLDLPDATSGKIKPDVTVGHGAIEFDHVTFSYRPGRPVLRDLTFVAWPGEVTAFVGPSGGGKTTIFNLVLALYAPQGGAILVDAQSYDAVAAESIRRNIAYLEQDVFLFRGTIRQNIALGRPDATEAEVIAAARAAHADEFVSQQPAGYDTPVGERGMQLSHGQRQRIAIARALIRDAPVILLDEPTAALDAESERRVQDAMAKLIKGRTTLVIAHRLHTVTHADTIHVVEKGEIVESGSHADLMARGGRYAQFFAMRFGRETEPAAARVPEAVGVE